MITIFNRKTVFITFSMERQVEIKDILNANGIIYCVKVVNRRSSSAFGTGTRSITGSYGENFAYMYEYIFYVHKKDFELAEMCINKGGEHV